MNDKQLIEWLNQNSSGVYRPAQLAASRIEELKNALKNLVDAVQAHDMFNKPRNYIGGDLFVDSALEECKRLIKDN